MADGPPAKRRRGEEAAAPSAAPPAAPSASPSVAPSASPLAPPSAAPSAAAPATSPAAPSANPLEAPSAVSPAASLAGAPPATSPAAPSAASLVTAPQTKIPPEAPLAWVQAAPGLLSLSDPVLLGILGSLSTWDLLQVRATCSRLRATAQDRSLYTRVCLLGRALDLRSMRRAARLLTSRTRELALQGRLRSRRPRQESLSEALLADIALAAPALQQLCLHECLASAEKVTFQHFPTSITHLSLEGCEFGQLPADRSFFKHIDSHLPHLTELHLTRCGWVKNHCLMALCKLESLRVLDLRGCHRVGECFAYTALATRFGFNSVEVFDLRDTNIGDTEVQCFGRKAAVLELRLGGEQGRKVTDRGILSLVSSSGVPQFHSRLQRLVMAGTSVTDSSLDLLAARLPSLRHLDVSGSRATEAGADRFRALRHDCQLLAATEMEKEEKDQEEKDQEEEDKGMENEMVDGLKQEGAMGEGYSGAE